MQIRDLHFATIMYSTVLYICLHLSQQVVGCSIRHGRCSDVSFALLSHHKTRKARLSVFGSMFVPILINGHEPWVMTEGLLSQMQMSKI